MRKIFPLPGGEYVHEVVSITLPVREGVPVVNLVVVGDGGPSPLLPLPKKMQPNPQSTPTLSIVPDENNDKIHPPTTVSNSQSHKKFQFRRIASRAVLMIGAAVAVMSLAVFVASRNWAAWIFNGDLEK